MGVRWRSPAQNAPCRSRPADFQDRLNFSSQRPRAVRCILAAARRRERFFDDLMARTMKSAAATPRLARFIRATAPCRRRATSGSSFGARYAALARALGRHLVQLTAQAAGLRRSLAARSVDLSAGFRAGQSVAGPRPFPFSPTTSVRALRQSPVAVAASPSGQRRAPPAARRATPQRVTHGKQNADRRLPSGGNPGGGGTR